MESNLKVLRDKMQVHAFVGTYSGGIVGYAGGAVTEDDSTPLLETATELKKRCAMSVHDGTVKALAMSTTGRVAILATGGIDEYIKLFDLDQYRELGQLSKHEGAITTLKFSPDGRYLLSGSQDGLVCVWRVYDFECLAALKAHKKGVLSIDFHPSGKLFLSTGKDKRLKLWNMSTLTGNFLSSVPTDEEVHHVRFSPSGNYYACLGLYNVYVYKTGNTGRICAFEHNYRANDFVFLDDKKIVTAGEDKILRLWHYTDDTEDSSSSLVHSWASGQPTRLRSLGFSRNYVGENSNPTILNDKNQDKKDNSFDDTSALLWAISSNGVLQVWNIDEKASNDGIGLTTEDAVATMGKSGTLGDMRAVCMTVGVIQHVSLRKAQRIKAHKSSNKKSKTAKKRKRKEETQTNTKNGKTKIKQRIYEEGAAKRLKKFKDKQEAKFMKKRLMISRFKKGKVDKRRKSKGKRNVGEFN